MSAAAIGVVPVLNGAPATAANGDAANPCNQQSAVLSTFANEFVTPPALALTTATNDVAAAGQLVEKPALHQFDPAGHPGATTATWAYDVDGGGNTYLGPTIVARRGTPVELTVTNDLGGAAPPGVPVDENLMKEGHPLGSTAVHLHGGHSEIDSDGGPYDTFADGSRTYKYVNDQEAAGLWYHDHALGNTRLNVFSGLAGGYVLRDEFDTGAPSNPEGLPTGYGTYELPVILQDRTFNSDMTVCYESAPAGTYAYTTTWIPEYFGDTAIVNGVARPYLDVEQAVYRVRLYNGSQSRFYNLQAKGETANGTAAMYQIGDSGGLLNAPVRMPNLLIAPGQRADLLLDFRAAPVGATFAVTNNTPAPYPSGPRAEARGGIPLKNVMQFRVTAPAGPGATVTIPRTLRGGPGQPAAIAPAQQCSSTPGCVRVRNIYLNELLAADDEPQRASVNNVAFDSLATTFDSQAEASHKQIVTVQLDEKGNPVAGTVGTLSGAPLETPTANTVEQWNFINTTADAHPMHLHLVHFRLIGRQLINTGNYLGLLNSILAQKGYTALPTWTGTETSPDGHGPWPAPSADPYVTGRLVRPKANESGWMDTVIVPPGQITRVLIPFGGDGRDRVSDAVASWAGPRYSPVGTVSAGEAPYSGSFVDDRPYVFHCHILEHEENDMMLGFRVTAPSP